ncbi:hypothetical protein [Rhizobium etli]|uniref:hypothetical protein n=1 Tax=Rhizobium etli TaxID=29449 RepID=UPI00140FA45E|nr:hypothetical protein [Rhizobium etli]
MSSLRKGRNVPRRNHDLPQHAKTTRPSDIDVSDDPGISRSRGIVSSPDDEAMQAENTVEGDTANDTTPQGGVDPRHRGRTNK